MRKYEINERIIRTIENMYEEPTYRIKIGMKGTRKFWTGKGLRQGCPLSPLLFLILIADVEEFMKGRSNGGAQIGKKRIFTLAYADDLAALATEEDELKRMLKSLEKYFRGKEMSLNVEKSKVLVFSRKEQKQKGKNMEMEEADTGRSR